MKHILLFLCALLFALTGNTAPACNEPWTAPAAPPSDCISCTNTVSPKMFLRPCAAHSSTYSAMVDDGVMG